MLQIKTLRMKLSIEIDKSVLLLGLSGLLTLQSGTTARWYSMKIPNPSKLLLSIKKFNILYADDDNLSLSNVVVKCTCPVVTMSPLMSVALSA